MLKFTKPPAPEAGTLPRPDTVYDKSTGKQFRISRRGVWIALGIIALVTAILLTVFGSLLWQLVGTAALLIAVIVVVLIALIVGIITLLVAAITRTRTRTRPWLQRLLRLSLVLGILLAGVAGAVGVRSGQDVSAMNSLAEHYYNGLQAPHKELIWLQSGHGNMNERGRFQAVRGRDGASRAKE